MRFADFKEKQLDPDSSAYLIIAVLILICSFIGIATRPTGYLAFLWPANAALLAFFLRFPQLNNKGGWLGAFSAYMFADLLTGDFFLQSFFLTLSNLLSTIVSLFCIRYFKINYKYYNSGFTFIHLFGICAFAGCLASAAFAVMTLVNIPGSFITPENMKIDFFLWWTGEMVNYIIILPLVLAFPTAKQIRYFAKNRRKKSYSFSYFFPMITVAVCVVLTHIFAGPGALIYPLAALIWAALTYRIFTISIINTLVLITTYSSLTQIYLADQTLADSTTFVSLRIGLFMLALAPLILCIISQNRNELYKHVLYLANYDSLTRTMNRHYFFKEGESLLKQSRKLSFSLIMLDIDYFKRLNDQYGHHVGDAVLQQFSELVRTNLRSCDLFARIGGEEFVVLLWDIEHDEAHWVAERIRKLVQQTPIYLEHGKSVHITVSLGITHQEAPQQTELQDLINIADQALYQAKHMGRNQVVLAS